MSRIRFETVGDVFEALPTLGDDITVRGSGEAPLAFMTSLVAGEDPAEALAFCAYVLPRREAVGWYCRSLRAIKAAAISPNDPALRLAEAWVREPGEALRLEALALVEELDKTRPASWAAIATAWSGGSLAPPEFAGQATRTAAPYLVAKAIQAGFSMLIPQLPSGEQRDTIRLCIDEGLRIAGSEGP